MIIRDFEELDFPAYYTMARDFYAGGAALTQPGESAFFGTFVEASDRSPLIRGLVFEQDGKICGYALLAFYWSCEAGGKVCQIEEVYVKESLRGKGAGREFFDWLFSEYAGKVARYRLEVCPGNTRAAALYERLGFKTLDYVQMIRNGK